MTTKAKIESEKKGNTCDVSRTQRKDAQRRLQLALIVAIWGVLGMILKRFNILQAFSSISDGAEDIGVALLM
jgi:hypothetical protein